MESCKLKFPHSSSQAHTVLSVSCHEVGDRTLCRKHLVTKSLTFYKAPEDYTERTLTLTFGPNVSCINVTVTIVDDIFLEGDQSFFGNLSSPVAPIIPDPDVATVTIIDNDRKCV